MKQKIILSIILTLFTTSAFAQSEADEKKASRPATPVAASAPSGALPRMQAAIVEVKHRKPRDLASVVSVLSSPLGKVIPHPEMQVITVQDYPENVARIREAITRLDVPETGLTSTASAREACEIQLHLIASSRTSTEKSDLPVGLEPVIAQLQETLRYKGYRYITTFLNRVEPYEKFEASGVTDPMFPLAAASGKSFYKYSLGLQKGTDTSGKEMLRLNNFRFNVSVPVETSKGGGNLQYTDVGINTTVVLREGEKVVVGTANLGSSDEAIILVVSAKKLAKQ